MKRRTVLLSMGAALSAAPPDPQAEKEVLAAMEAWRQAFLKKDEPALRRLLHDDLVYSHSNGRVETKAQFLEAFLKGQNYARFELKETLVKIHGSVALVQNTVDIRGANSADNPFLVGILHVWNKAGGNWQIIARHAARLNPPAAAPKP